MSFVLIRWFVRKQFIKHIFQLAKARSSVENQIALAVALAKPLRHNKAGWCFGIAAVPKADLATKPFSLSVGVLEVSRTCVCQDQIAKEPK